MKRRIYLRMQSWEEALEAFFERILIVPHEHFGDPRVQKVLAVLRSGGFRVEIEGIGGYNTSMMGEEIAV